MTYTVVVQWMGDRPDTILRGRTYLEVLEYLENIYKMAYNEQVLGISVRMQNEMASVIPINSARSVRTNVAGDDAG